MTIIRLQRAGEWGGEQGILLKTLKEAAESHDGANCFLPLQTQFPHFQGTKEVGVSISDKWYQPEASHKPQHGGRVVIASGAQTAGEGMRV